MNKQSNLVEKLTGSQSFTPVLPDEKTFATSRVIRELIIHCSATKAGHDFRAADIHRWHHERGFADIGYHFVIDLDGTIEVGRPMGRMGAHCLAHNRNSVGICYVGGLDKNGKPADTRTAGQRASLTALLKALRGHFPQATIHGHREFAAKACPCFDAQAEYAGL